MTHSNLFADLRGRSLHVGARVNTPKGEEGIITDLRPWRRNMRGLAMIRLSGGRRSIHLTRDLELIEERDPVADLRFEIDEDVRWLNSHHLDLR
jgi:hypothetical protein